MSQSGKLVFIIDSKSSSWTFICLWYLHPWKWWVAWVFGGVRCQGSRAATWLPKQMGCFLGLERALGLGSSFWRLAPSPTPGQLWTSQLIFLSVVSCLQKEETKTLEISWLNLKWGTVCKDSLTIVITLMSPLLGIESTCREYALEFLTTGVFPM